jgi:NAD-reducing hydrogenase small subunit
MSFLDLDEFLIELAARIDLVFSPLIDVKEYPDNVDLCLVEGAVCNQDNLEMIHKVRRRTRILLSFGDCAVTGNVSAIRNELGPANAQSVLQCAYIDNALSNPALPTEPGIVPALLERVQPVHEVVYVDYFLPGCPPPAERIKTILLQLLQGAAPKLEGAALKFG